MRSACSCRTALAVAMRFWRHAASMCSCFLSSQNELTNSKPPPSDSVVHGVAWYRKLVFPPTLPLGDVVPLVIAVSLLNAEPDAPMRCVRARFGTKTDPSGQAVFALRMRTSLGFTRDLYTGRGCGNAMGHCALLSQSPFEAHTHKRRMGAPEVCLLYRRASNDIVAVHRQLSPTIPQAIVQASGTYTLAA